MSKCATIYFSSSPGHRLCHGAQCGIPEALGDAHEANCGSWIRDVICRPARGTLLRVVVHFGPVSAGVLASASPVHPGMLSTSLGRLDGRGLLLRNRVDSDARRVDVTIIPADLRWSNRLSGTVEESVSRVLNYTESDDMNCGLEFLRAVCASMPTEMSSHESSGKVDLRDG